MPRFWARSPTASPTGTLQGWQGSWTRGVDEACQLAGRALAAGPDNSTCLASAAFTYGVLSHRFEEAFELANRALMVHPNSLFVRNRAAAVYAVCGESDKAIAQCEAACRMNPLDSKKAATHTFSILSAALYMARRYRGVHPRRQARVGIHSEHEHGPQVRCHIPRPAWPHRRSAGRDRRAHQVTSPTLHSLSSANTVSATSGCASCIWRACARRACGRNSRGETFGVALCLVAQPPDLMLHSRFVSYRRS